MMRPILLLLAVSLASGAVRAETYTVRPDGTGDFPTIQAAIDAAEDGDIVELADGTFTGAGNRDVDYHGKALTIQSQGGEPAMCTIDCEGSEAEPHRGFHFISGETFASVLEGITITGGYIHVYGMPSESSGGAIRCFVSSPMIRNCRFVGNHASHRGGAVYCDECSPTIDVCVFESNTADWGSGLGCGYYAHPEVTGCVFRGNGDCYGGGGIFCGTTSPQIRDCTFVDNSARNHGGAIWCGGEECPLVSGCTMIGNSCP
jgi:predicted outer membrane repeat protein